MKTIIWYCVECCSDVYASIDPLNPPLKLTCYCGAKCDTDAALGPTVTLHQGPMA